jgi:peptidoglycan/LPS O-acetylase OafA/YrhL
VVLAYCLHDPARHAWFARWLGPRLAAPILLLGLVVACSVVPEDIRGFPRLVVHVLMFFLLASTVIRENHGLARFLLHPAVARIGTLSYGIYLLHHIALGVVSKGMGRLGYEGPLSLFVVGSLLSIGLAELSYRFYETPFLRLRERFRR